MSDVFNPYRDWLGIPGGGPPSNLYVLLGVEPYEPSPQAIVDAAERQIQRLMPFQSADPYQAEAARLIQEVETARNYLLDPQSKAAYDAWLWSTASAAVAPLAAVEPPPPPMPTEQELAIPSPSSSKRLLLTGVLAGMTLLLALLAFGAVKFSGWLKGTDETKLAQSSPAQPATAPAADASQKTAGDSSKSAAPARPAEPAKDVAVPGDAQPPEPAEKIMPEAPAEEHPADDKAAPGVEVEGDRGAADAKPPAEVEPKTREFKPGVPEPAAQAKALEEVRAVYRADYTAAQKPANKKALAEKLLTDAADTRDDTTACYVMLTQARELALEAGEPSLLEKSTEILAEQYDVDARADLMRLLDKNADARLPAPIKAALAPLAMKLAEESLARDRYPAAERLAKAARLMSAGRDSEVAKSAQELLDRLPRLAKDAAQLKKAEEALAAHPNDPAVNLAAGKIHCFSRNTEESWNLGLSLLIKGSDPVLKIVAEAELAVDPATAEPADAVRLGDLWFDAATGASEDVRADCRRRAIHWYQQALPGLQGFSRAKITRRLEDLGASSARETEPKTEEKPAPKSTAKAESRRGAGAASEESSGKQSPPKAALLNPAIQRIRSQYKEQLAKGAGVDTKRQLIRDLYKAAESAQDPATQFAMLQTSRDIAVELGNPDWFDPIIGAMDSRFTIDVLKMKIECVKLAWQSPSAKTYQKPLTDYARQLLDDAMTQKDRVAAEQALVVLVAAARATNNNQLLKELEDKLRQANPAAPKGRK